jgi:hypothetical protein
MQIGIVSDVHLHLGKKSNYIDYIYKSLDFFFDECSKRNITTVYALGDIVEYKDKIDIFVLTSMLDYFRNKKKQGFLISFLVGNHETVRRADNDINFLKVFEEEFEVFADYSTMVTPECKLHFMPYFKDDILEKKIELINIDKKKKNYLFTHLSFKNFDVGGGHEDVWSEMTSEQLENIGFDHIFSGHYHKHQTKGKTTYISSPMMTNFGEVGEEKYHGFVFFDVETGNYDFIKNPHLIKYKKVELSKDTLPQIMKEKNCYFEIILDKHYDYSFKEKLKEKLEKNNYKVEFSYNISKKNQAVAKISDWTNIITEKPEDVLKNYVSSKEKDDIIKKELMEIIV